MPWQGIQNPIAKKTGIFKIVQTNSLGHESKQLTEETTKIGILLTRGSYHSETTEGHFFS